MSQRFYDDATCYALLPDQAPDCFAELDDRIRALRPKTKPQRTNRRLPVAHNLCRRMAQVDWYADQLTTALEDENQTRAAILADVQLLGFFGACLALLDAAAIAVAQVAELALDDRKQTFTHEQFWIKLEKRSEQRAARYRPYRKLAREVAAWHDSAAHRVAPLVTVDVPEPGIWLVGKPESTWLHKADDLATERRVHPLHPYRKWRPVFVEMCTKTCHDLGDGWAPAPPASLPPEPTEDVPASEP